MKKAQPHIIMYYPTTPEGRQELARRVAQVHADAVTMRLKHLNCPNTQKLALLDAVIETVKARSNTI